MPFKTNAFPRVEIGPFADRPVAPTINGLIYVSEQGISAWDALLGVWESSPGSASLFGFGLNGPLVVAAGTTNLSEESYFTTVDVAVGATLNTNGFRVIASEHITNNGTITNNGQDAVADAAGAGALGGTLRAGSDGGAGKTGGAGVGADGVDITDPAMTYPIGGLGGAGGADGAGDAGGAAGAATTSVDQGALGTFVQAQILTNIDPGTGGGGGGADGTGSGGGGGGGGGMILLAAPVITLAAGSKVKANGGDGGDAGVVGNAGGGGGGGGGVVILAGISLVEAANTIEVNGGAAGAKTGTGVAGTAGGVGDVYRIPV